MLLLQTGHPSVSPKTFAVFFLSKMDKMQLFKLDFFSYYYKKQAVSIHQEDIFLESVVLDVWCRLLWSVDQG